ncbi:MAG: hypothetical protein P8Y81_02620 [Ignavibacteriaceae bacterium]
MYFVGFIHDTSFNLFGSLRFNIVRELMRSPALSPININLHGVKKGVFVFTFIPASLPTS